MSGELSRDVIGVPPRDIRDGVLVLAEAAGRNVTEATFAVYASSLSDVCTPAEWGEIVARARDRVKGWTTPGHLHALLAELREELADEPPTEAELQAEERARDARHAGGQ